MFLRKKNFSKIKNVYNFFNISDQKIILVLHVNNLNFIESNFIQYYTTQHDVKSLNIDINLTKKISLNLNFLNLLSGPTKLYKFDSFSSFLSFFNNKYIFKKLIPLTVFWNNNFFCYKFFTKYLSSNINSYDKNYKINSLVQIIFINNKLIYFLQNFLINKLFFNLNFLIFYENLLYLLVNYLLSIQNIILQYSLTIKKFN